MGYPPSVKQYNTSVKDSEADSDVVQEGKTIIEKVAKLKYEMTHDKPLEPLDITDENAAQLANGYRAVPTMAYDAWIHKEHPTWFSSTWLYAECYLYRKVQSFFETSQHWKSYDPFSTTKSDTFHASHAGIHACAKLIQGLLEKNSLHSAHDPSVQVIFDELVSSSLWGNATDLSLLTNLSYADLQKLQATSAEQRKEKKQFVLVNQMDNAWDAIKLMNNGRVDIVLDNAGFELITDLVLADWLLTLRGTVPRASKERIEEVQLRCKSVLNRIKHAAGDAQCDPPRLLAVSKLQPPSDIMAAYDAGQRRFGENYAQELVEKAHVLPREIEWHLIGGLQSNKAKILAAVPNLRAIESVDSIKLASNLEKALSRPENEVARKYPLDVYLQVNTSMEEGKSGVAPLTSMPDKSSSEPLLLELAKHILLHCPHLRLKGLMTIGAQANSQQSRDSLQNPDFETLQTTRRNLQKSLCQDQDLAAAVKKIQYWSPDNLKTEVYTKLFSDDEHALELSMGMSADLESAIAYGGAEVRIGSDCFGARSTSHEAAEVRQKEIEQSAEVPLVKQVVFHPKNTPWFVSDACVTDVQFTIDQLLHTTMDNAAPVKKMAARWQQHFDQGAFKLQIPQDAPLGADVGEIGNFWTQPEGYGALVSRPSDLIPSHRVHRNSCKHSNRAAWWSLRNYRKLTQDAEWPSDTPFTTALGDLAGKFPILALRTCKAEVCVGLLPGQAESLNKQDPEWRTNGHWAGSSLINTVISFAPSNSGR